MGTLTADTPSLAEHCSHKLPSSCRLTATPYCCACQDKRPHAPSYSIYIDGVGFVPRGTRWQRYCWFCKEFWENRVAAADPPIRPAQTRIPELPDQTEFLEKWFDFHRGCRTIKREDGTEQQIAVLGEPLKEAAPGTLPRTLDEVRNARSFPARRPAERSHNDGVSQQDERPSQPLDSVLDELFEDAKAEEESQRQATTVATSTQSASLLAQSNREASTPANHDSSGEGLLRARPEELRVQLGRLHDGIDTAIRGLSHVGASFPNVHVAADTLSELRRSLEALRTERVVEGSRADVEQLSARMPARGPGTRTMQGRPLDDGGHRSTGNHEGQWEERHASRSRFAELSPRNERLRGAWNQEQRTPGVDVSTTTRANELRATLNLERRAGQMSRTTDIAARARVMRSINRRLQNVRQRRNLVDASSVASQLEEARSQLDDARTAREDAAAELEGSESEVQAWLEEVRQLERQQRSIENYTRLFGTREEVERQGAEYESPIGGMFNRAWERYRTAEEVRRSERTLRQVLEQENRVLDDAESRWYRPVANPEVERITAPPPPYSHEVYPTERVRTWSSDGYSNMGHWDDFSGRDLTPDRHNWALTPAPTSPTAPDARTPQPHPPLGFRSGANVAAWRSDFDLLNARQRHLLEVARQQDPRLRSLLPAGTTNPTLPSTGNSSSTPTRRHFTNAGITGGNTLLLFQDDSSDTDASRPTQAPRVGLDVPGSSRPPPVEDKAMMVKMECKVCYSQQADTALLPCGHCVMCNWCADMAMPLVDGDESGTRLVAGFGDARVRSGGVKCPVCRRSVRRRVRIVF